MSRHPAFIGVWDDERQDYRPLEPHERICTARWASTNRTQFAGDLCGGPADHRIGDMWVCQHHCNRAETWVIGTTRAQLEKIETERQRLSQLATRLDRAVERRMRDRLDDQARQLRAQCVVYFVRRGDGLVKIGTSRVLQHRLTSLAAEHGPLELLGQCPGSYETEREWHERFAACRIEGEWFRPSPDLRRAIRRASRERQIPARG